MKKNKKVQILMAFILMSALVQGDEIKDTNIHAHTIKNNLENIRQFTSGVSKATAEEINEKGWLVDGKALYTNINYKDKNRNGHESLIYGGVANIEYGLGESYSIGSIVGGSIQELKLSDDSNSKANTAYIGLYGKKDIKNLSLLIGGGYQQADMKTNRMVDGGKKIKTDYLVNGYNVFTEGRYNFNISNSFSIVPQIKFSYTQISQEEINEKVSSGLRLEKEKQGVFDTTIGIDFTKKILSENGEYLNTLSLGVIKTYGEMDSSLKGNVNVDGMRLVDTLGIVGYELKYKINEGITYTGGVTFEFGEKETQNISAKVGLEYKFDSLESFVFGG